MVIHSHNGRQLAPPRRISDLGGQRLGAQEATDRDLVDGRLRATRDHNLRVSVTDHPERVTNAVTASRASRHARVVRPLQPVSMWR